ncbi:sphingomyelin synthase-related protein 1 isoform X3 [Narcine bancroftii]|uniref:sphingomyelin synthase-related protein 1 isoform X3 n=1 Tax=Narcine bancroftii TaxID=1343680 RepID=UPI0038319DE9
MTGSQFNIRRWTSKHVAKWLKEEGFSDYVDLLCNKHRLDGIALLTLTEYDLRCPPLELKVLGDIKRLMVSVRKLQKQHKDVLTEMGYASDECLPGAVVYSAISAQSKDCQCNGVEHFGDSGGSGADLSSEPFQNGKYYKHQTRRLDPEFWKTVLSSIYVFIVFGFTSVVMVIVHERVPDMQTYPPLPDIFLDSVPRIPWAFAMAEVCGVVLSTIWLLLLLLHKHRTAEVGLRCLASLYCEFGLSFTQAPNDESIRAFSPDRHLSDSRRISPWPSILLRRMCSLMGTVFLLRCVTMFVTSLSVPGHHLQCSGKLYGDMWAKLQRALAIWSGFGMTLTGVHTCGDYMFSGHTVVLTMLNFFVTEYTPRSWNFLHTLSWFIMAVNGYLL